MNTNEIINSEIDKQLIGAKITIRGIKYHGVTAFDVKGNRHLVVLLKMVTEAFTDFMIEAIKKNYMYKEDAKSYLREIVDSTSEKIDRLESD